MFSKKDSKRPREKEIVSDSEWDRMFTMKLNTLIGPFDMHNMRLFIMRTPGGWIYMFIPYDGETEFDSNDLPRVFDADMQMVLVPYCGWYIEKKNGNDNDEDKNERIEN